LHELQAYLSDHYYLINWDNKIHNHVGSWQLSARDFDPSQPLFNYLDERAPQGKFQNIEDKWWRNKFPNPFSNKRLCSNRPAWIKLRNLPDFKSLIELSANTHYPENMLTLWGSYEWKEPMTLSNMSDLGQLRMWIQIRSWIIPKKLSTSFIRRLTRVHFWGNGCSTTELNQGWLGEYPWFKSHTGVEEACKTEDPWLQQANVTAIQTACRYHSNYVSRYVPSPQSLKINQASWAGQDFIYTNKKENTIIFSPITSNSYQKSSPCLANRPYFLKSLDQNNLTIVWGILGERHCSNDDRLKEVSTSRHSFSAVYNIQKGKLRGGITKHLINK